MGAPKNDVMLALVMAFFEAEPPRSSALRLTAGVVMIEDLGENNGRNLCGLKLRRGLEYIK